jgi:mRNA-degrading endonuclease toxin of MazEF toxin-antitoxin module
MAAKVRPCLILSVPTDPLDRVLVTVVPHTTSVQGTYYLPRRHPAVRVRRHARHLA